MRGRDREGQLRWSPVRPGEVRIEVCPDFLFLGGVSRVRVRRRTLRQMFELGMPTVAKLEELLRLQESGVAQHLHELPDLPAGHDLAAVLAGQQSLGVEIGVVPVETRQSRHPGRGDDEDTVCVAEGIPVANTDTKLLILWSVSKGRVLAQDAVVLNPRTRRYVRRQDGKEIEVSLDEVRELGEYVDRFGPNEECVQSLRRRS